MENGTIYMQKVFFTQSSTKSVGKVKKNLSEI